MWLHSLESVDEHTASVEIDSALVLGDDTALDMASGPEGVPHLAPWGLGVGAESACTILANDKAGSSPGELEVDDTAGVCAGLDVVAGAILGESDGAALCVEVVLLFVKAVF